MNLHVIASNNKRNQINASLYLCPCLLWIIIKHFRFLHIPCFTRPILLLFDCSWELYFFCIHNIKLLIYDISSMYTFFFSSLTSLSSRSYNFSCIFIPFFRIIYKMSYYILYARDRLYFAARRRYRFTER